MPDLTFENIKKKNILLPLLVFFINSVGISAQTLTGSINAPDAVCEDTDVSFTAVVTGATDLVYQFSIEGNIVKPYSSDASYGQKMTNPGLFAVTVAVRSTSDPLVSETFSKNIEVVAMPVADAGEDVTICFGTSTRIGTPSTQTGVTYSWTPGNRIDVPTASNPLTTTLANNANNLFTLKVTSNRLATCSSTDDVIVITKAVPSVNPNNANYFGGTNQGMCNGSTKQMGGNALEGTDYEWSSVPNGLFDDNTLPNPTATPVPNTPYSVTVTLTRSDLEGCSATYAMNINPQANPPVNAGEDKRICSGSSVQLGGAATNGVSYSWQPNMVNNPTVSNPTTIGLNATTQFVVTATYNTGCSSSDTVNIEVVKDAGINYELTGGGEYCEGTSTAGNYVELSGSETTAQYALYRNGSQNKDWQQGSGSKLRWDNLTGGQYTVVVKNEIDCERQIQGVVTINEFKLPTVAITAPDSVCSETPFEIDVDFGGTAPFTFTIESPSGQKETITTTQSNYVIEQTIISNVSSVNTWRILDISDSSPLSCKNTFSDKKVQVRIDPLPRSQIDSDNNKPYACAGEKVILSVRNPDPTRTYDWSTHTTGNSTTIYPNQTATYRLTTTDHNKCRSVVTHTIPVRELPEVSISGYKEDMLYCSYDENVSFTGTPPEGNFSGNGMHGTTFHPSEILTGFTTIQYAYTDDNQCTGIASVTLKVNQTPQVNFSVGANPFSGSTEYQDAIEICFPPGGELLLQGIATQFKGEWELLSNAGNAELDTIRSGLSSGQAYLVNCEPGAYQLQYTVTDNNGCVGFKSKTVNIHAENPDPIPMGELFRRNSSGFDVGDTMCITSDREEIWVQGTTDASGKFNVLADLEVSQDAVLGRLIIDPRKAPAQNTYTISYSMVDAKGCTHSTVKDFYINSPINIQLIGLQENYCIGGDPVEFHYESLIPVSGVSFSIVRNGTDIVRTKDDLKSGETVLFYPSWGTGEYEFIYTYSDGVCENTHIQRNVKVNDNPTVDLTIPDSVCYGNAMPLIANPPGGSFYYKKDTETVKIPVFASSLDTKEIGTGKIMIYYSATQSGCPGSDSTDVQILGVTDFGLRQRCTAGDEKTVYLTGSEADAEYILYADNVPFDTILGTGSEVQFKKTISTYAHCFVWAETKYGCRMRLTDEITIRPLDVKLTKTDISCFGRADGTTTAFVSGGVQPYDFMWSYPGGDIVRDSVRKALSPGTYTFAVKDSVGCSYSDTIEVIEPDTLQVTFDNINDPKCAGDRNGSADAIVSGGTFSFDYKWIVLPGQDTVATTASLINVGSGTYEVRITDRNGCKAGRRITFNQNPPLAITVDQVVHNTIFGEKNGEVDVTVTGGEAPYSYLWRGTGITSANENDEDLTGLPASNYFLSVTDSNDCRIDTMVTVKQPEELLVDAIVVPIDCHGKKTGSIALLINGGQKEYSVAWTGDDGYSSAEQVIDNLAAGVYHVTVTDASGKSYRNSYEVTEPQELQINTLPLTNTALLCNEDSTGILSIDIEGGTTPYIIQWASSSIPFGQTNLTAYENLPAGNYLVRVTDFNRCVKEQRYEIKQPTKIDFRSYTKNVSCAGRNDGSIILEPVAGGTKPYSFFWSGGNSVTGIQSQSDLFPATYYVEIQDANNCTRNDSFVIKSPVLSTVKMSAPETFCSGDSFELRFDFTGVPALSVAYSDGIEPPEYISLIHSPAFIPVGLDKSITYQIDGATDGNKCPATYSGDKVDVTMLPSPILTVINIPKDICRGENIEVDLLLQQGPVWSIEYNDNGGIRTVDNITDAGYKLKIATNRPGNELTYEIISISNGQCKTPVNIPFTVNVRNYPVFTPTPPAYVCAGDTFMTKIEFEGDGPWVLDYHSGEFSRTDSIFDNVSYIKDVLLENTAYHFNSVTSGYGCITEIDRQINVEVNPLPDRAFTITGTSAVCLGESDYTTPLIERANSYHWTLPEGVELVSGNETNKIKVRFTEKSKAGLITVQGKNDCGLGTAASIYVTAPKIIGKAGVINSAPEICRGTSEPIVISTTPIENADKYSWLLPPGFDIEFGENSSSIMVITQRTAQSGIIKVWGENHCASSDTISLRISILEPPIVVAGADKTVGCNEENSIQLEALNPAPASGQWRLVLGSGIIADIYDPHTKVTGLDLGRNVFHWEVSDGKCASTDSVTITNVNVDLTSPAFSKTVTCMDSMALKAGKPRQGTGEWSLVGGGGILVPVNETETMVYELEMGTNFFRWKVFNEYCSRDTVIQIISNSPRKYAFAGEDETVYMPASVMNARMPDAEVTGKWSIIGGSSVLDNTENYRSIVRNLSAGLNTFRWTVTHKNCVEFDEVTIFYDTDITDKDKEDFILFPNAFTPNPTESNGGSYTLEIQIPNYRSTDVFYPVWHGVDKMKGYALQIFNRWGQLIFRSNDIERGWDGYINGELAPQGTYIYKASGVFSNGKTFTKTGEISLLH
jgi:gliding motility-associated-like protein